MTDYLSLTKAAKLVGATREEIQRKIRKGLLPTFEGFVSEADLKTVYPHFQPEDNADIERLQRLQESALNKSTIENLSDTRRLKLEILKLHHELRESQERVLFYQNMTAELETRLVAMQADCTHRQKLLLKALLAWMHTQLAKLKL